MLPRLDANVKPSLEAQARGLLGKERGKSGALPTFPACVKVGLDSVSVGSGICRIRPVSSRNSETGGGVVCPENAALKSGPEF